MTADEAIASARAADRAIASGATGPLTGVPIAIKDLFDTAGVRTTAGSALFRERVPVEDAEVVRRLRSAGAISVGKTSLHEWAFGVTNQNPHFGPARNPWDTTRIPGGSSGGSAAALATAMCYGALGSDTGGSIRIPASLCGVVGLKPTYGRVSVRGVIPLAWTLDHAGPMARTVRDAAVLYHMIAGYDARDPLSTDVPVEDALPHIESGARGLVLGVPRSHFFERADDEVAALVRAATAVLEREGARIAEVPFPASERLLEAQTAIISADAAAFHAEHLRQHPDQIGADVLERLRRGEAVSGTRYALARHEREILRREVMGLFASVDALVVPTTAIAAPPAEGEDAIAQAARLTAMTSPFNLTGLPAISVPCGFTAAGLPVGLQVVAAPWREATVLRIARAYERATSWSERRPATRTIQRETALRATASAAVSPASVDPKKNT